jgi:flagellar basal-body rod protein FlgC
MDFFSALEILTSGMRAERIRMNVSSSNLANAKTTRTAEGGPYRRQKVVFEAVNAQAGGFVPSQFENALKRVEVTGVEKDMRAPRRVYDPGHPDADKTGYVSMPNVNMVEEMVTMMTAARTYEANLSAMRTLLNMAQRSLKIGK